MLEIHHSSIQVLPSLPASKRTQVESLQRKLAESETGAVGKSGSAVAGVKDIDVKVSFFPQRNNANPCKHNILDL